VCAFWGFAVRGKGTPLPIDPPKKLLVEGPYSVVRNPMYWGVVSVMLGEAAVFHSVDLAELAGAFFLGVNVFVLLVEEPSLKKKFGAEYEEYCRRVPRWLPRFKGVA
jgi:protein-S-isoprenylcysteine O-methyltransferase Ste14